MDMVSLCHFFPPFKLLFIQFYWKNRIGFFYIHVRILYIFPKSSHISWNNTMDTHRCLSMQCNIIALDYLFNGFSTIPTYYFQFFLKKKRQKRLRGRVPLRTISFIYRNFSCLCVWFSVLTFVLKWILIDGESWR